MAENKERVSANIILCSEYNEDPVEILGVFNAVEKQVSSVQLNLVCLLNGINIQYKEIYCYFYLIKEFKDRVQFLLIGVTSVVLDAEKEGRKIFNEIINLETEVALPWDGEYQIRVYLSDENYMEEEDINDIFNHFIDKLPDAAYCLDKE